MKSKILLLIALIITATQAYAGNGDLIVDGKLGVGTTNPASKLDVNGDINAAGGINTQGGANFLFGIGISQASNALSTSDLDYNRAGGQGIQRINYHTGLSLSAHSAYGGIRFYNQGYSASNPNPYDSTTGAQMVMAITGGNVGIGTTNPAQGNLVIGQDSGLGGGASGSANRLVLAPPHHTGSDWYFTTRDNTPSSGYAYLDIGYGGSALSIRHDGNVGIGTTNPTTPFYVSGTSTQISTFDNRNTAGYGLLDFTENGTHKAYLGMGGSTQTLSAYAAYAQDGFSINSDGAGAFNISNRGTSKTIYLNTGSEGTADFHTVTIKTGNVGIGTTNPNGKLDVWGNIALSGTVIHSSDAKFKKNLLPINTALDKVLSLSGHTYEWKTEEYKEKGFPEGRHYGVIAQEIEKVLPEVVNTGSDGTKAVAYTEIIPVLIEAIKEQQKRIELLEKKLAELQ